jgi:hypothetical protein
MKTAERFKIATGMEREEALRRACVLREQRKDRGCPEADSLASKSVYAWLKETYSITDKEVDERLDFLYSEAGLSLDSSRWVGTTADAASGSYAYIEPTALDRYWVVRGEIVKVEDMTGDDLLDAFYRLSTRRFELTTFLTVLSPLCYQGKEMRNALRCVIYRLRVLGAEKERRGL